MIIELAISFAVAGIWTIMKCFNESYEENRENIYSPTDNINKVSTVEGDHTPESTHGANSPDNRRDEQYMQSGYSSPDEEVYW